MVTQLRECDERWVRFEWGWVDADVRVGLQIASHHHAKHGGIPCNLATLVALLPGRRSGEGDYQ
jgi:hypothetical protein